MALHNPAEDAARATGATAPQPPTQMAAPVPRPGDQRPHPGGPSAPIPQFPPNRKNQPPPEMMMAQLALMGVQNPQQLARLAAAKGILPFDLTGAGGQQATSNLGSLAKQPLGG